MGLSIDMRLFTIGCSFTKYHWPTWADIIGVEYNYQNWGQTGAGNFYIYNSLVECNIVNKLTADDTVCIMWTNVSRHDSYHNGKWMTGGNQRPQEDLYFGYDLRGLYIRDLSLIYGAQMLLESIGCQYVFTSMVDIDVPDQYNNTDARSRVSDVLELYKPTLDIIRPSVHTALFNQDWNSRPFKSSAQPFRHDRVDLHPTPLEHLEYVDQVLPTFTVSDTTRSWCEQIDARVRSGKDYSDLWKPENIKRW